MRSSRSATDPLDPGRNGFAHRGVHRAPAIIENTLTAFAAAMELGAGIECDVRLTADNRLIVFHDADAMRLCGDARRIIETPLAGLADLRVGGHPIATLDQALAFIAGRVPLLIEVKIEGPEFWRVGPALLRAVKGYAGSLGLMSFDPRLPRWLKTNAPHLRRGLVIEAATSAFRRRLGLWLADPQFLALDIAILDQPWVQQWRARMPVYSWTAKTRDDGRRVAIFADAPIWEADGRF